MDTGIQKAIKDGNGNAIIMTAVIAAAIANFLPTPADYFYFSAQSKNKEKLEKGEITPKQYWTRDILGYYSYTAIWYMSLFLILQAAGGTYKNNARILIALLSGGLVIGIAQKNIKRDEELQTLAQQHNIASS